MKDRGMVVKWTMSTGETVTGKVSSLDNADAYRLFEAGKLEGKVIVRVMEPPQINFPQVKQVMKKYLVKADKLKLIGYYD